MGEEREIRGIRWALTAVVALLSLALSFELLSESHQARLDHAWRARHNSFQGARHANQQQELARRPTAGDASPQRIAEWVYDDGGEDAVSAPAERCIPR